MSDQIFSYLKQLHLPQEGSHKGQNGKVLMIGGSELFHAASKWSLDVASKFVDMVFYASVPSNNELIQAVKKEFWNGIVIRREEIDDYIQEANVILIGPGMERTTETENLTNSLLQKYSAKKWVLDAGALQMVDVKLLNQNCIITPHRGELERVWQKTFPAQSLDIESITTDQLHQLSNELHNTCILLKGVEDRVVQNSQSQIIKGGNPGMTKGGTGDALAGLVAALFCTESSFRAAVIGSYINKKAGEALAENVGPFFNASELVTQIPKTLWSELQKLKQKD